MTFRHFRLNASALIVKQVGAFTILTSIVAGGRPRGYWSMTCVFSGVTHFSSLFTHRVFG